VPEGVNIPKTLLAPPVSQPVATIPTPETVEVPLFENCS
jgi:hypothetical protein